jgi:hypothetical protein
MYFVLTSGASVEILNCSLRKYINNNTWIKHLMLFFTFYICGFILQWYTVSSIVTEENFGNFNKIKNIVGNIPYLRKSFYYTLAIYLIFILSTKNEGNYLFIFLISIILIFIGTIYTKSINSDLYIKEFEDRFITLTPGRKYLLEKYKDNEDNEEQVKTIIILQNTISIIFIISLLILIIGAYSYYLKQSKDYSKNWSWLIFWFGYNKQCKNSKT